MSDNVIDKLIETLQGLKENGGAIYLKDISVSHHWEGTSEINMTFIANSIIGFEDRFQSETRGLPEPQRMING